MARLDGILEFLNTLKNSSVDGMIKISEDTMSDIIFFLQNAHEKIGFLQLESQLQQAEL